MSDNRYSLFDAMRALFPTGYLDYQGYQARLEGKQRSLHKSFLRPPCQAVDLFAIAAFLLHRSGGYHHISPMVDGASTSASLVIDETSRSQWIRAGRRWRGEGEDTLPAPPKALTDAWRELIRFGKNPLFLNSSGKGRPRPWWRPAMALLAIADEAARDLGFEQGSEKSAQAAMAEVAMRDSIQRDKKVYTVSNASNDQVCVLPKSRTPKVGCTLRSLTHNLSLLPSRGLARAFWSPHPQIRSAEPAAAAASPFNLIVIPLPYQVQATAFKGTPAKEASWGWFHVAPHWCPSSGEVDKIEEGFDQFWRFVEEVLDSGARDVGTVHGLVFPEAALSYEVFTRLCEKLENRQGFELLVSGVFDSQNQAGDIRPGNFAAMARRDPGRDGKMTFNISTREKHHRWRIEKSQIEAYALGSSLDSSRGWWEQIDILNRSLDVFVLRGVATVTTLICEDLARSDPCQELVRGIGPNLVIALLMDGPQLKDRWPARYATVLAEDPGSSVLTVTSAGLLRRSNDTRQFPASDKIGLWRDDTGRTSELSLAPSAQALCLTLQPTAIQERTLDGRADNTGSQSWRLTGMAPVIIRDPNKRILDGQWPDGV
ncbi:MULTISPECIES: hypothetical protein [Rhizobium/Agrobacterium group]|uniref:hypothetical protein n=1 Tax=Rhizobium/Agrobacterium group TaxID=227290 RepID=UPI001ADD5D82|nr:MULTISPECIES: hypothetical protein [Rhizobium/Agrobacterium group]MBO9111757.1 hypothetical protein [Agrobacterium sp. S2/73]QXZ76687.1 hypothetical protein J5276_30140 [Agrobacterium sp. S7/73]QYA17147.1 hypothetical protein J5284_31270 [Rhizobium sp. AB2/73]UEQ85280.1 hypothetical protein I8E17_32785 [Rhizobium sp. AB2/73]